MLGEGLQRWGRAGSLDGQALSRSSAAEEVVLHGVWLLRCSQRLLLVLSQIAAVARMVTTPHLATIVRCVSKHVFPQHAHRGCLAARWCATQHNSVCGLGERLQFATLFRMNMALGKQETFAVT